MTSGNVKHNTKRYHFTEQQTTRKHRGVEKSEMTMHIAVSKYMNRCDKCNEMATRERPLAVFETSRIPTGGKRQQFHAIYLHKECAMQLLNAFTDMVNRGDGI